MAKKAQISDLKKIPGIGTNMEQHLQNIGITCIADLVGKDPEELYQLDCLKKVLRTIAVYFMLSLIHI